MILNSLIYSYSYSIIHFLLLFLLPSSLLSIKSPNGNSDYKSTISRSYLISSRARTVNLKLMPENVLCESFVGPRDGDEVLGGAGVYPIVMDAPSGAALAAVTLPSDKTKKVSRSG
jgi:hypothetical protein